MYRNRPPAVPLVTIDPHTNVWSQADRLTDDWPRHWTGSKMSLYGVVRVDGVAYRFMGGREWLKEAAEQIACEIGATKTSYLFRCGPVELSVEFVTPLLVDDLDLLSRPITYLTITARSLDAESHRVSAYVDMTGEWAVNLPHERVFYDIRETHGVVAATFRSELQRILPEAGDHRRIEWGTSFLAGRAGIVHAIIGDIDQCRDVFAREGRLTAEALRPAPRKVDYNSDAIAAVMFGLDVAGNGSADETVLIAYDDEWSVEYFGQWLRPWWRRAGDLDPMLMLSRALEETEPVLSRAAQFDASLENRALEVGGPGYSRLLALTWRQAVAAHKLVAGPDGRPLFFSKENFSNGCIGTVDVTYPSAPLFLIHNPELLKAMMDPIFAYCASPEWPHPFPAHDLGTYPIANGQTYRDYQKLKGPDENIIETQMPVEEAGNMLILTAAVAQAEGHARYAEPYWAQLQQWADYLVELGFNPGAQLCTDDFSGVLGQNVNLSAKAIMGIACFARLSGMRGARGEEQRYRTVAECFAHNWLDLSKEGLSTRLAFDQPGTWSLKYNLVWDRLLGLGLFPEHELRREQNFYRSQVRLYGVPLDQRGTVTKPEWMLWAASLTENRELFEDFVERILRYTDETPNRVPFSDLYFTDSGRKMGFQARSVLGGLFVGLLAQLWCKPDKASDRSDDRAAASARAIRASSAAEAT
jgi:hypothetical protein